MLLTMHYAQLWFIVDHIMLNMIGCGLLALSHGSGRVYWGECAVYSLPRRSVATTSLPSLPITGRENSSDRPKSVYWVEGAARDTISASEVPTGI